MREALGGKKAVPEGTRIYVRERFSLKVLTEVVRKNPEEKILAAHCRFAGIPIRLKGKDLRRPLSTSAFASRTFAEDGFRGEIGLLARPGRAPESRVALCIDGIQIVELGDGRRLEVQLAVHTPAGGQAQTLVRNLTRVVELGIASANLDHYGRLPRDHVDLVKQAIRFARRTSG